jgi:hypothetical protein
MGSSMFKDRRSIHLGITSWVSLSSCRVDFSLRDWTFQGSDCTFDSSLVNWRLHFRLRCRAKWCLHPGFHHMRSSCWILLVQRHWLLCNLKIGFGIQGLVFLFFNEQQIYPSKIETIQTPNSSTSSLKTLKLTKSWLLESVLALVALSLNE